MDALTLAGAAREAGDEPALFAGDTVLTFAELEARARTFAGSLAARGITAGSRVAILAQNRVETVIAVHALLALGAAIVPIHPRLTPAEVAIIVEDARPALTLREGDLDALLAGAASLASPWPDAIDPEAPLAIVYTSGTTGRPKGALLSRRAFLAGAEASAANLGWLSDDRWLLCMPLCHIGGLSILTRCLAARRAVILEPRFDPDAVLAAIVKRQATLLSVVPTMLAALLERDQHNVLARLRAVLCGGAATPWSLLEECGRRAVPALTTYGLTEACSQATSQAPRSPYVPERGSGSGKPLPGVEIRIDAGRIHLRGPTLMSGYFRGDDRPPDTSSFSDDGWLDTGDLGELDEAGRLHVHARRTDLIVTGGENVYPLEIEQCLEALPGVRHALVFGVPDARWGQLVAAAIEIDSAFDEAALAAAIAAQLAPHKRPRLLAVVTALAVTGSGKLVRASAAERHAANLRPLAFTP
jgi:o-succinylbenzoate---CoA ligase